MSKIREGLKEAIEYANDRPSEGTRRRWYDAIHGWIYEEFRDGYWVQTYPRARTP